MLVRFSVENFLSFEKRQGITMIPAKVKIKSNHLMQAGNISLLKVATIYGANASGKSNLVKAISFARSVVINKLSLESTFMFCKTNKANEIKQSKFEFEIFKNGRYYAYGFSAILSKQKIETEWLYELFPEKSEQVMLFEREITNKRLDIGIRLTEEDQKKYETYKLDFGGNSDSLFVTEMNRNKKIDEDSGLYVFKTVYAWFKNDLITIFPDQPVTDFEYFYGEDDNFKINTLIDLFDTGISKVRKEEITLNEFREKVPAKIADKIIESIKTKLEDERSSSAKMSLRTSDAFFNLVFQKNKEPIISTIKLEHGNSFYDFDFGEESDGTRRLFDLLEILISNKSNVVYVIDEMERSLHPKLTYRFLELFFEFLSDKNIQLIFTTHESTIMDQELLRRDEIWFVERKEDNASFVYSLDRFKERYDKKISKAYLDGRYGAIPIFKKFIFKDGDYQ